MNPLLAIYIGGAVFTFAGFMLAMLGNQSSEKSNLLVTLTVMVVCAAISATWPVSVPVIVYVKRKRKSRV